MGGRGYIYVTVGRRKSRWVGLFSGKSGWRCACALGDYI